MDMTQDNFELAVGCCNGVSNFEPKTEIYGSVYQFLIQMFNMGYYTCVIPFRIKKSKNGDYKIHTNKFQSVITSIFNCIVLVNFVTNLYTSLNQIITHGDVIANPELLAKMLSSLSQFPIYLTFFFAIWKKRSVMESFVKLSNRKCVNSSTKILILNILAISSILAYVIANIQPYCTTFAYENLKSCILNNGTNTGDQAWGILIFSFSLYSVYLEDLIICLLIIAAIMMHHNCLQFSSYLHSKKPNVSGLAEHYLGIRKSTQISNAFFGPVLFYYVVHQLFNSLHFPFQLEEKIVLRKILSHVYIAKFYVTLIIAAEGSAKVKYFREWLFQYKVKEFQNDRIGNNVDSEVQNKTLYEILKSECGITKIGFGCSLFNLTYGFLGLFISVLATYGAFQLQFYNVASAKQADELISNVTESTLGESY